MTNSKLVLNERIFVRHERPSQRLQEWRLRRDEAKEERMWRSANHKELSLRISLRSRQTHDKHHSCSTVQTLSRGCRVSPCSRVKAGWDPKQTIMLTHIHNCICLLFSCMFLDCRRNLSIMKRTHKGENTQTAHRKIQGSSNPQLSCCGAASLTSAQSTQYKHTLYAR